MGLSRFLFIEETATYEHVFASNLSKIKIYIEQIFQKFPDYAMMVYRKRWKFRNVAAELFEAFEYRTFWPSQKANYNASFNNQSASSR